MEKQKREYIIPEAPDDYEAYLYIWHLWIEELNQVDYSHSSKQKRFKNDLARSKRVIFEILQYGKHEEMAIAEGTLLKNATNEKGVVVGAAASELWYNKTNGGGLYGKGSLSTVDLNTLWACLKPMLDNHQDISIDEIVNGITKKFIPEEQLEELIRLRQFLQTRGEEFVASHVDTLCIVSGNHRSRGNINCPDGIGLNSFQIPHDLWKGLKGVDFVTLSNRCNPDPEKPALEMSPESAATWIINCLDQHLG